MPRPSSLATEDGRHPWSLVPWELGQEITVSWTTPSWEPYSLTAHFKETAVGKSIPPSEGNKLGLHSLEMFTNLNSQIKLAEFQPTLIKIAS